MVPCELLGWEKPPYDKGRMCLSPFSPLFSTLCEDQVPSRICRGSDLEGNF